MGSSAGCRCCARPPTSALYPNLLPAREGAPFGLTIDNAASGDRALGTGLFWWPVGIALAATCFAVVYSVFILPRRR